MAFPLTSTEHSKRSVEEWGQIVWFYGFPFKDDVAFYKAIVDPSWEPYVTADGQGREEPNLEVAINQLKQATGISGIAVPTVFIDGDTDAAFMLAVAQARKGTRPEDIPRMSEGELRSIAKAAGLGSELVPCWLRSVFTVEELEDIDSAELKL